MRDAKVFVSYSNRDAAVAEKIAHALQGVHAPRKWKTFLDRKDIGAGEDIRKSLYANLETSDAILVVAASPDAVSNSWVSYEIGMAEGLNKPIIVLTSNRYSPSDFREDFKSFPIITFDPEEPEGVAQEIAGRLTSLAARK
jgi:nucleoside 2-deoxyribosyltransferase